MEWNKPVSVSDLQPGDHVYVYIEQNGEQKTGGQTSALSHHGIYVGNNEVIHFCGPSVNVGSLREEEGGNVETAARHTRMQMLNSKELDTGVLDSVSTPSLQHSRVLKSSTTKFCALSRQDGILSFEDCKVRRYRYGVKTLEVNYLASLGTCTTLAQQKPEQVVRVATFYADHPSDFGEHCNTRTSEHFAVFCSVCDVGIDETSQLATPPSLMVPILPDEILAVGGAGPGLVPNTTKGKIAAAATATCGLVAAGTMWGVAPAMVIGGAVFASAKYVVGRKEEKTQLTQKKQE